MPKVGISYVLTEQGAGTVGVTRVRNKGQVTIPSDVREAAHIEEGTVVEFSVADDGAVVMRPKALVAAEDAWFFSAGWQEGEREARAEAAAGKGTTYASEDDFLASLDEG
jgi:AbrB family looped-hinge helix DNA binding protein